MIALMSIALQVATQQPASMMTDASASQAPTSAVEQTARQPKRICRTVLDNRTGPIAKSRKICRTVQADEIATH